MTIRLFLPMAALSAAFLLPGYQGPLHESEDRVVHYNRSSDLADPIAKLQQRITAGDTHLAAEPVHGYLVPLLRALNIPFSSQGLVFSKTSLQNERVGPARPRAVYFGDNAYVSWVPGGDAIDIAAIDPNKGAVFYTLDQRETSAPHFERRDDCTGCHLGPKTLNVPGLLLRSVITAPDGQALFQVDRFSIGHGSPIDRRWGGWYVTAANDQLTHMGNTIASDPEHPQDFRLTGSVADLRNRFDITPYLSPGSDAAALLVLAHQVKMHNLITRASYETRYALADATSPERVNERIAHVAEPLLEYMLFRDEASLNGPIEGSSTFTQDFRQSGPRDSKGRSLRDLDLQTRLLRYPCSYLIYSQAFDSLPRQLKVYLWRRLAQILRGNDQTPVYAGMAAQDREAIFEILRETKPEFAEVAHSQ